jgi:hypothetical protein
VRYDGGPPRRVLGSDCMAGVCPVPGADVALAFLERPALGCLISAPLRRHQPEPLRKLDRSRPRTAVCANDGHLRVGGNACSRLSHESRQLPVGRRGTAPGCGP